MDQRKLTPKEYWGLNRSIPEGSTVKLLPITDTKILDFENKDLDLSAGFEFLGQLDEKLMYGDGLTLSGDTTVRTKAITSATRTDQGRFILTDVDGGIYVLEIVFRGYI